MADVGGIIDGSGKVASALRKKASRHNTKAVKFSLRVWLKQVLLPTLPHGVNIFVLLARGANRKRWSSPLPYTSATSSKAARAEDAARWEGQQLSVPVTLYQNAKGSFQSKPFKLKVFRVPGDDDVAGDDGETNRPSDLVDDSQLASFTLDASQFVILSPDEAPTVIRIYARERKSAIKAASIQLSVACVYDAASQGRGGGGGGGTDDDDSTTVTGSIMTQNTSSINGGWSKWEQDLEGFEEDAKSWDPAADSGSSSSKEGGGGSQRRKGLWHGRAQWWKKGTKDSASASSDEDTQQLDTMKPMGEDQGPQAATCTMARVAEGRVSDGRPWFRFCTYTRHHRLSLTSLCCCCCCCC